MNVLTTAVAVSNLEENERNYVCHEAKYALLGALLFLIFIIPWTDKLIKNIFPLGRGPMIIIYKVVLYVIIYYIIQKTDWFQSI
jgi:hypothetical protein